MLNYRVTLLTTFVIVGICVLCTGVVNNNTVAQLLQNFI